MFSVKILMGFLVFELGHQICTEKKTILSVEDIIALIGNKCDGVIGQVKNIYIYIYILLDLF